MPQLFSPRRCPIISLSRSVVLTLTILFRFARSLSDQWPCHVHHAPHCRSLRPTHWVTTRAATAATRKGNLQCRPGLDWLLEGRWAIPSRIHDRQAGLGLNPPLAKDRHCHWTVQVSQPGLVKSTTQLLQWDLCSFYRRWFPITHSNAPCDQLNAYFNGAPIAVIRGRKSIERNA